MPDTDCPLCGSSATRADSDNSSVRYCSDCGAMLNVGGVEGVTMESLFKVPGYGECKADTDE